MGDQSLCEVHPNIVCEDLFVAGRESGSEKDPGDSGLLEVDKGLHLFPISI